VQRHGVSSVKRAVVCVTVALLALAGCRGRDEKAAPTTTSDAAGSSTTELTATSTTTVADAILAGYRAFWDGYLEAADPMSPDHPVLERVATGGQLRQLRSAFLARRSAGEVIRGELDLAPRVTEVDGGNATVSDCYLDRTGVYDAATGQRKDRESGVRHRVTVRLVREGSDWKVASISREGDGCTPGAGS
jgi:hypothetical protein